MRLQVLHLPRDQYGNPQWALVVDEAPDLVAEKSDARYAISDAAEYAGANGALFFADTAEVIR